MFESGINKEVGIMIAASLFKR